jgi:hypothetical protein
MEEKGVATGSHSFARKLASSDVKTREKGMGLLVLWLSCQQVREVFFFFMSLFLVLLLLHL